MDSPSRRDFARLLALSGTAALFPSSTTAGQDTRPDRWGLNRAPLPPTPAAPDESFWREVRARFLVPPDLAFLNAANLCPASLPVIEALEKQTRLYEASPSPEVRAGLMQGREAARILLAEALHVTPDEIVITRNTSEGNNFVSSGLDLKAGDEVIVWADNHPTNLNAWRIKAARFGFTVVTVPTVISHPGADGFVALFAKAFTARTRLVAITHVNSNSGDLLPVAAICRAARERGVLSLVDGAQAFGVLDLDLGAIGADFYTGSMHKWPCGPKETGMLYVNRAVHGRIHPSVVGVYAGAVGISRKLESTGQRDDVRIAAVSDALKFQSGIGRAAIERRSRSLAQALMAGLSKLDGVKLWTDPDPAHSSSIVIFQPGSLDIRRLGDALTTKDRIICTTRPGPQAPGIRLSPHFYNTIEEMERTVGTIRQYLKTGV